MSDAHAYRARWLASVCALVIAAAGDWTLRRSFSLLDLSVLAANDLKTPFMSQSAYRETLAVGIDSLAGERGLRGFEPGKGWVHATAHAADLLKFLARLSSPKSAFSSL